jgi:hypothetical protein
VSRAVAGRVLGYLGVCEPAAQTISTLRGLLADTPEGSDAAGAVGWSIAVAVIGYVWSVWLYRRHAAPSMPPGGRCRMTSDHVPDAPSHLCPAEEES